MKPGQVNLAELRERAELALAETKFSNAAGSELTADARELKTERLLEELRIYQTELEIQNQELVGAQAEISSALAKYRNLFEQLPLTGLLVDGRGFIVEANEQARTLFKLHSNSTLFHRSAFQLFEADSRDRLQAILNDRKKSQPQVAERLGLKVGAGETATVDAHVIHLFQEAQVAESSLLVLVDKSADEALRNYDESLQKMAAHIPGMVYQFQRWPDGRSAFPYASEGVWNIYGVRPAEVLSDASVVYARIHPLDFARVVTSIEASAAYLTLWHEEYRVNLPDGRTIWVEGESSPELQTDRSVLWHGHIREITARKQLEAELDERMQELKIILENSSVGIAFLRDRKHQWANQRFCEIFGYSEQEFRDSDTQLLYAERDDYDRVGSEGYPQLLRGERYQTECQMRRKSGEVFWARIHGKAIDPAQPETGTIWVLEDISLQKATENTLHDAVAAAEAATIAKSRFLATMSHEIRTPMNGILGMAQLLLSHNLSTHEQHDYARTILNSGKSLLTLLNDILDLSKVEAGKFELEATALDIAKLIDETHALFHEVAVGKGLHIDASWEGPAQRYLTDSHRLRQMLSNLIGNALKFTAQGEIRIEAREVGRDGQIATLEFAVVDTGIGIAEDKLRLLFQPFSQADSSTTREFGGSGLGLSIVRSLARLMNGDVGVTSTPGQGSRFWFRIQAGLVAAETDSRHDERTNTLAPTLPLKLCGQVLVVEDNPTNQKVIEALLNKLGLNILRAEHGEHALALIMSGETPDVILMDLQMPVMDGYVATENIRRWQQVNGKSRSPIIALTADAFEEDRQHCLSVGMDGFITKPIEFDVMTAMLGKWLAVAPSACAVGAAVVKKTVDRARVVALVAEIIPLLVENKFNAIGRYQELREALAGTDVPSDIDELNEIGALLNSFCFDQALHRLRVFAAAHGWELES